MSADDRVTAVSGPTEIDRALSPRQAALAWLEYGSFRPGAMRPALAGNNMAFRRAAWSRLDQRAQSSVIEQDLAEQLVRAGGRIVVAPDMRVHYQGGDGRSDRLMTRFHHGRLYGGGWAAGRDRIERSAHVLAGPAIVLILAGRAWRQAASGWGWLAATRLLPWMLALAGAWTIGETVGVVFGAGGSLAEWR